MIQILGGVIFVAVCLMFAMTYKAYLCERDAEEWKDCCNALRDGLLEKLRQKSLHESRLWRFVDAACVFHNCLEWPANADDETTAVWDAYERALFDVLADKQRICIPHKRGATDDKRSEKVL